MDSLSDVQGAVCDTCSKTIKYEAVISTNRGHGRRDLARRLLPAIHYVSHLFGLDLLDERHVISHREITDVRNW